MSPTEYEELVQRVVAFLAGVSEVKTERLERDVVIRGKSTGNQIDVVWEVREPSGKLVRFIFEARRYGRPIDQKALHAFRSTVSDIAGAGVPTRGVMVTTIGYQSGAKDIACTYGIGILNMRKPTPKDWEGRVKEIHLTTRLMGPITIEVLEVDLVDPPAQFDLDMRDAQLGGMQMLDYLRGPLLAGETHDLHLVDSRVINRRFDPPILLGLSGKEFLVAGIHAKVAEPSVEVSQTVIDGAKRVAWLTENALDGSFITFADNGELRLISTSALPTIAGLAEIAGVHGSDSDLDDTEAGVS